MAANSLLEIFVKQLQNLYDSELQVAKSLPHLIGYAKSKELRTTLIDYLEACANRAGVIEEICQELDESPRSAPSIGMQGIVREGDHLLHEVLGDAHDLAIIATAQRAGHYEMAGYGAAYRYAAFLGYGTAAKSLAEILEEKKKHSQELFDLAEEMTVSSLRNRERERKEVTASLSDRSQAA